MYLLSLGCYAAREQLPHAQQLVALLYWVVA